MLSFNYLQVGLFVFLFISSVKMSITSKTCWPELIGKTADEAVKVIKEESGKRKHFFLTILFY